MICASDTQISRSLPSTRHHCHYSPPCSALLVIEDNSNSNDISLNTDKNPSINMTANTQTAPSPPPPPPPASNLANDTFVQQRRRNSSIAKLLGGQPLAKQQYEEINQQILEDQSAHNTNANGDNGADGALQRSRSSITRTLLMTAERNNVAAAPVAVPSTTTTTTTARPVSPAFSKDFEYLIRRELDTEHASTTFQRDSSAPSVFQNLATGPQSPVQPKIKRKRNMSKQPSPSITTVVAKSTPPTIAPFALREPFVLKSPSPPSASSLVSPMNTSIASAGTSVHRSQNNLARFDAPYHQRPRHQSQLQYAHPVTNADNSLPHPPPPFTFHKLNMNSPLYTQFSVHHDRVPLSPSQHSSSSSCNCCRYPPSAKLNLPSPMSTVSSSPGTMSHNNPNNSSSMATSRKTRATRVRPDLYEIPLDRLYSSTSVASDFSSSSSSSSSSTYRVPLKKRLLEAYKNEQHTSSSL